MYDDDDSDDEDDGQPAVTFRYEEDEDREVGNQKKAAKETKKKGVEKKKKKSKDTVKKNKHGYSKKACQNVHSISTHGVLNSSMNELDKNQSEHLNKEEPKGQLKSPFQNSFNNPEKGTTIASPYEVLNYNILLRCSNFS